ncbi:MAG: SDR family NAD(P)-dependent oxidoreductase, partial [Chlamydiia bacterium]|nr:SDR family NAD(P)-dependent oxidoreductase [Chlamydiia bacterium]
IGPGRTLQDRARKFAGQTLPGNPDSPVNLIDQETIVHAITWALNTNQTGIFNLAHPEHPTRGALYNQLAQELGVPPIHWDPTLPSKHGGNKKISSAKIHAAGFQLINLGW